MLVPQNWPISGEVEKPPFLLTKERDGAGYCGDEVCILPKAGFSSHVIVMVSGFSSWFPHVGGWEYLVTHYRQNLATLREKCEVGDDLESYPLVVTTNIYTVVVCSEQFTTRLIPRNNPASTGKWAHKLFIVIPSFY